MFRWIMKNPGRGVPYGYDSLAEAADCGPGLIEKLATGRQKTADMEDAHSIVRSLGVAVLVLFAPPASPELDDASPGEPPTKKE